MLGRPGVTWIPGEAAKGLASSIPDARLVLFDGESTAPYLGDMEATAAAIERFFDEDYEAWASSRGARVRTASGPELGAEPAPKSDLTLPDGLTDREVQVLRLVAGGLTNTEVAAELNLSIRTVERHIGNIYAKIGARGRADATVYALTQGLV